jgi:probable phosphoglycerate mutase
MVFVRHGESQHHVNGLTGGWTDTPLTPVGKQQIESAVRLLQKLELGGQIGLYASDLRRAAESATIIGEALGYSPVFMADLREINNGKAAGLTLEEARKIRLPESDPPNLEWRPYENAETWREVNERLATGLRRIESKCDDTAIVVGHGLSGQALVRAWLQLPLEPVISFHFDTASVTELRINEWRERQIVRLNVGVIA